MKLSPRRVWQLVGIVAFAGAATLASMQQSVASPLPASAMVPALCLSCSYDCGDAEHKAPSVHMTTEPNMYHRDIGEAGGHNGCEGGNSCFEHHPEVCPPDEDRNEVLVTQQNAGELFTTLANADAKTLTRALMAYGHAMRFNPEREAIQVAGCKGQIVLHVPLASETADQLSAELEALEESEDK